MKNIRELRKEGLDILYKNNIDDAVSIVDVILSFILKMSKQRLISYDKQEVIKLDEENFLRSINKIANGTPLEYITGKKEFMKNEYIVNENVLIPRQDTEVLVENVIILLKEMSKLNSDKIFVLDMCTGSGCIAISILLYLYQNGLEEIYNKIYITAIDISAGALDIAKQNAEMHKVSNKIDFIQSDLFNNIKNKKFDIVLSNPPYIKSDIICTLDKNVRNEPIIALDGGKSGIDFYIEISKQAQDYLNDNGYIIYEIGYDEANDVCNILKQNGYKMPIVIKDLSYNDRVVISKK